MENSFLKQKTFDFAKRVVKLYQYLRFEKHEPTLARQVVRSGTSIGANVAEAVAGISSADFSAKISIAYKEAQETDYWLRLLHETDYLDDQQFKSIHDDCTAICKILYSILSKHNRIHRKTTDNGPS